MSDSLKTQILDNLVTAIEGVTEANGYSRTVRAVSREAKDLVSAERDMVYVESQYQTKEKELLSDKVEVELHVGLVCVVEDRSSLSQAVDDLTRDIEKAIKVDGTRGGLAKDTRVLRVDDHVVEELEPTAGAIMEVEITFRHTFGNPDAA